LSSGEGGRGRECVKMKKRAEYFEKLEVGRQVFIRIGKANGARFWAK
jgi:hypothetical protein